MNLPSDLSRLRVLGGPYMGHSLSVFAHSLVFPAQHVAYSPKKICGLSKCNQKLMWTISSDIAMETKTIGRWK